MGINFSIIAENGKVLRSTSTLTHAVKHAAYASEVQITVKVVDNRSGETIIRLDAIDKAHAIKAKTKRDKRYVRKGK